MSGRDPDGAFSQASWTVSLRNDDGRFVTASAPLAATAGFADVRIRGEELLANAHGWLIRTLESRADPDSVPLRWRSFAFRSYLALQRLDGALLEPRLPPQLFYNLVLSARRR